MENVKAEETKKITTLFIELDNDSEEGVKITPDVYDLSDAISIINDHITVRYTDKVVEINFAVYVKSGPAVVVKLTSTAENIAINEMRYVIDRLCKDAFANVLSDDAEKVAICDRYNDTLSVIRAIEILNRINA